MKRSRSPAEYKNDVKTVKNRFCFYFLPSPLTRIEGGAHTVLLLPLPYVTSFDCF